MDVISSLLMIVIEVLACDLFFQTFAQERFPNRHWIKGIVLALIWVGWVVTSVSIKNYLEKTVVCTVLLLLLMLIVYRASVGRLLFCSVCYEGINWGTDIILLAIYQFFIDETATEVLQKNGAINLLWILFKLVFFFLVVGINRKFAGKDYQSLRDDEWIRFLFFPVFTIIAVFFMLVDENIGSTTMFVVSIGLIGADLLLFYLIRDYARGMEEKRKISMQKERQRIQIENYADLERNYEQQRKSAHEFRNHLGYIEGLLREKKEREALEYIRKLENSPEQYMSNFSTGNPVVDVIVNQKYHQAKTEGINMVVLMNDLKEIPMTEEDMVVLLSNLLNNAIEACGRLKEKTGQIKFKFMQEEEKVVLSIRNPIEESLKKVNGQVQTSKENEEEHGVGIGNIEKVIEKYGGEGTYQEEAGEFFYVIVFNIDEMKRAYEEEILRS